MVSSALWLLTHAYFRFSNRQGSLHSRPFQVRKKVIQFDANPIATNIDVSYPASLNFPAVAICNINQFRISRSADLFPLLHGVYRQDATELSAWEDRLLAAEVRYPTIIDFYMDKMHQIDDMLIACRKPNGKTCTKDDFSMYKTDFGPCFTINSDLLKPARVSTAGLICLVSKRLSLHGLLQALKAACS